MKLTGGPRLSARERGGEGGWPAGPRPKKRKEGRGGMGLTGRKKERERWKKGFAFFFFFKPKLQIHFQIEFLNKFDILFLKQSSQ